MYLVFLFIFLLISCEDSEDSETINIKESKYSTANILCDLSEEIYNSDESINANSKYSWICNSLDRVVNGNGIPNHEVGTFPNLHNPNSISVQNVNHSFSKSRDY